MPIVKSGSDPSAAGCFWNVALLCHPPVITVLHVMLVQHNCHAGAKIPNCAPLVTSTIANKVMATLIGELTPGP